MYNVLTILHCIISPTSKLKKKSSFNTMYQFSTFFSLESIISKCLQRSPKESTKELWNFFENVNLECQSPLGVFLREKFIFDFPGRRASYHVFNDQTQIQKRSYFHVFLEKDQLSFPVQRKNMTFSGKKKTIFPDNVRKIIFQRDFLKRPYFQNI